MSNPADANPEHARVQDLPGHAFAVADVRLGRRIVGTTLSCVF